MGKVSMRGKVYSNLTSAFKKSFPILVPFAGLFMVFVGVTAVSSVGVALIVTGVTVILDGWMTVIR